MGGGPSELHNLFVNQKSTEIWCIQNEGLLFPGNLHHTKRNVEELQDAN